MIVRRRAILAALLLFGGCSEREPESPASPTVLEAPERVLVAPFATLTRAVRVDEGVTTRVERAVESEPLNRVELRTARATQTALQQTLITRLKARDLPAEAGGSDPGPGRLLLIQGQIISEDRNAGTRHRLLAFGAEPADMIAELQLLYVVGDGAPQFLDSISIDARTRPAHATRVTSAAIRKADVAHLAEAAAGKIAAYAVSQGWLAEKR
ncbi:MAG: hypothetical protein AB7O80_20395 [Acetobacteraceae bacterium]